MQQTEKEALILYRFFLKTLYEYPILLTYIIVI